MLGPGQQYCVGTDPSRGGHEDGEGHLLRGATSPSPPTPLCSLDIDECAEGSHACRYNQLCQNAAGTYRCACPPGYHSLGAGWPCLGTSWGLRGHNLGHRATVAPLPCSSLSFPVQLQVLTSFPHQM